MTTTALVPGKTKQEMKTSNYITLFIIATVLILLAAGYFSKSLSSRLLLDRKVAAKKVVAADTLSKDIDAAQKLTAAYAALGTQKKTVDDALPASTDFPTLANSLNAIAGASGVKYIVASSSTGGDVAAAAGTSDFTMSLSGGLPAIQRFLTTLESSSRPMHVTSLTLSGTSAALDGTIEATTYNRTPASFAVTTEAVK